MSDQVRSEDRRKFIKGTAVAVAGAAALATGGTAVAAKPKLSKARSGKLKKGRASLRKKIKSSKLSAKQRQDFDKFLEGPALNDMLSSMGGMENGATVNVTVAGTGTISVD